MNLKKLNQICDKNIYKGLEYFDPEWTPIFEKTFNPTLVKKLLNAIDAANDLQDFLENEIGMDKPELTFLRQSLKDLENE